MIFPEHMEFRYYITPERKECYELYSMTLGCRRTLLEKTQDLGQCLVDLYDTDFYDTYCVLSEINKLLRPLTPEHKDETAWRKLLELAMPLCKVHPFFGLLIKELSDLEENHAYGKNDTKDILLRFDRDFENIVSDAKALIEVCLDDRHQPNYSTAERYREAHYDARLCFDDMRYGELATEEVMLERPAYDSAYNYSVEKLREQGITITPDNLKISDRATITMPYHVDQDGLEEARLSKTGAQFGSTKRGIAYTYGDKYMKKTLRMGDLLHLDDSVKKRLVTMVDSKNLVMEGSYNAAPISVDEMWAWLEKYAAIFKDYICDVGQYLADADAAGKKVLFEAQLGALRDIDFGIYPYTTSSNTIGAYAPIGAGIPGHKLTNSVGVMKAYSSCVGDGPFVTELAMTEEEKHALREAGHEYGAATGRPRRVGPIDLVASRYGVFCQGCDEVALTLLDVLDYMEKIPMVTAYKLSDGTTTTRFPMGEALDTAQPVVEYLPGWHCDITAARKWEDLPKEAQNYVEYLEKAVGCKITYISVGAEREAYIHHVV